MDAPPPLPLVPLCLICPMVVLCCVCVAREMRAGVVAWVMLLCFLLHLLFHYASPVVVCQCWCGKGHEGGVAMIMAVALVGQGTKKWAEYKMCLLQPES